MNTPASDVATAQLKQLRRKAADTIRSLAMDAVQKANSGHPGMPMGMADAAVVLWTRFLHHNPSNPDWPNRDRFILSAGHGSMLLYSLLHLAGYDLPMDQLKQFRQWGSQTPGHPENFLTPGVETTTGPLGQGISNAVGMALAERHLASRFNRDGFPVIDHYTYVICSDGDLMEGVSYEACSLAGHWKLNRLIVLYDDNNITIDGSTELSFSEDVMARFKAQGWHTQQIDGHDSNAVEAALDAARAETTRPSIIACKTHIGFGSPNKQDSEKSHGSPLGEEEIRLTKENLGLPQKDFYVPDDVYTFMNASASGTEAETQWTALWNDYAAAYPEEAALLETALRGDFPEGWDTERPAFSPDKPIATRAASGKTLDVLKANLPMLIGGSGDLTGSNKTIAKDDYPLHAGDYTGRYIHFGVREHGMGSILNGMNLHGGVRAYGGTFLVFSDYVRPAVRLAALMHAPSIFVFSHDSIGLGEDGPTHQPIEHNAALRAIPNLLFFRPADAYETAASWYTMLQQQNPCAIALTRQGLPILDPEEHNIYEGVARGAYVLSDTGDPQVLLLGTGSEVHIALEAQQLLAEAGIGSRVVSMPCWELFEAQPESYKNEVLPPDIKARVSVEAGVTFGWERYVGDRGVCVGLDRFGASAPYKTIYTEFGITAQAVAEAAQQSLRNLTKQS